MADTYEVNIEGRIHFDSGLIMEINTPVQTGSTPAHKTEFKALASGDNSFTAPTGAKFLVIIPDSRNTSTYKLKGVGGDTGIVVGANKAPMLLNVTAASAYIINSSGTDTYDTRLIWF